MNIYPGVKKAFKTFVEYGLRFLKFACDEIIIFAKDFREACKFMYNRDKNQWWPAAKRNWWKFAKYFGVVLVFWGLNLSLVTVGFVLGSLIISKILGATLPLLDNYFKNAKKENKSVLSKVYVFLQAVRILLPVLAVCFCVAHLWLLLPGLIMMFLGGFVDRKEQAQKKIKTNELSHEKDDRDKKENQIGDMSNRTELINEKEKQNEENTLLKEKKQTNDINTPSFNKLKYKIEQANQLANVINAIDNAKKLGTKNDDGSFFSSLKIGIKNYFMPPSSLKKNEEIK